MQWDADDLVRRICTALEIAAKSLQRLAVTGYRDELEPANNLPPEKLIAETAVLLIAASVVSAAPIVQRWTQVAHALVPHARGPRMRLGLCLRPALAWDYALPHVCLQRLGFADKDFEALFRRSLRSQARDGRERPPHRVLEIEWLRGMRPPGTPEPRRTITAAARAPALNRPMDLFGDSRDDIYAFTHAVMYAADFRLNPAPLPRPK